jgi:hypothetical protein
MKIKIRKRKGKKIRKKERANIKKKVIVLMNNRTLTCEKSSNDFPFQLVIVTR